MPRSSSSWADRQFAVHVLNARSRPPVHHVCRDMGFTHVEGLVNMDKLIGKGRFKFVGFPLKIRGGTGSPVRAVAMLEE